MKEDEEALRQFVELERPRLACVPDIEEEDDDDWIDMEEVQSPAPSWFRPNVVTLPVFMPTWPIIWFYNSWLKDVFKRHEVTIHKRYS